MTVAAKVVNLSSVTPRNDMVIGLDTNVLYWLGYSKVSTDADALRRARPYYSFIAKALKAGTQLQCTALSLVEAIYLIEKCEYWQCSPRPSDIKKFRQDVANRHLVGNEIDVLLATAQKTVTIIPSSLGSQGLANMLRNLRLAEIDAYDMGILESFSSANVKMIVSDDHDLATYDGDVMVLTANQRCLNAAVEQSKLHPAHTL